MMEFNLTSFSVNTELKLRKIIVNTNSKNNKDNGFLK